MNKFTEKQLREGIRKVKSDLSYITSYKTPKASRFTLPKYHPERVGNSYSRLAENFTGIGFQFEQDRLLNGRIVNPENPIGWFLSITVNGRTQNISLNLVDQNEDYARIAEVIEEFAEILD